MALNSNVMQAVEKLDYRVTIGDVASQAGMDIKLAERDLLALASEAGGHLQVAESGEVAYLFPRNFRGTLRNKYWRLRFQEWWQKVWGALFYLIRISFGILLIASIVLIALTIIVIITAANSNREGGGDNRRGGGGFIFLPRLWLGPDLFWFFNPRYSSRSYYRQHRAVAQRRNSDANQMNFFEAVFSFLFGDGNPNADLEERRWQAIATVIRNNGGAVAAEQIAPYLDNLGEGSSRDYEDYMLPVLTRFNGRPEVSPEGQLVYHFPALQVTAKENRPRSVSAYLKEEPWQFSLASSNQIMLASGLGAANFIGALVLGGLLTDPQLAAELGGLVAFVDLIYPLLLAYGIGFLAIPLVRYFWVKWRNRKIESQNEGRQQRAIALNQATPEISGKIAYARQFAAETVVTAEDLAYTTETDLLEQEANNPDKIDAEWRRRLGQSES